MVGQAEIPWDSDVVPNSVITAEESLPVQLVQEFGERKIVFATPTSALGTVAVADFSDAPAAVKPRLKSSGRRIEYGELAGRFLIRIGNLTFDSEPGGRNRVSRGRSVGKYVPAVRR